MAKLTLGLEKKLTACLRRDQVPVAVVCCSLCEVDTKAMCRRLGPH